MSQTTLFVVSQTSTVCYLAPLWRLWSKRFPYKKFFILVDSVAARQMRKENIKSLNWKELNSDAKSYLDQKFASTLPNCLIMSARGSDLEYEVLQFALQSKLPVARIIDTWYGYKNRLSNSPNANYEEIKVLVIDEVAKAEAVSEGVLENMIEIVGQPAWENLPNADFQDQKKVLFASQPIQYFYEMNLGYTEQTVFEIVLEARSARPDLFSELSCALHPEGRDMISKYSDVNYTEEGPSMLQSAGTIIGMFSSLMTEGILMGRHVLAYRGNVENVLKCVPDMSLIQVFSTPDELIELLEAPKADMSSLSKSLKNSTIRLSKFCFEFGNTKI